VLEHDFKTDPWARGTWLALKAGASRIQAQAAYQSKKPWDHTRNLFIAGSDVCLGWSGWIEGAVQSGYEAARHMAMFLDPEIPEGEFRRTLPVDESIDYGGYRLVRAEREE